VITTGNLIGTPDQPSPFHQLLKGGKLVKVKNDSQKERGIVSKIRYLYEYNIV
jgi:hypothetical protein